MKINLFWNNTILKLKGFFVRKWRCSTISVSLWRLYMKFAKLWSLLKRWIRTPFHNSQIKKRFFERKHSRIKKTRFYKSKAYLCKSDLMEFGEFHVVLRQCLFYFVSNKQQFFLTRFTKLLNPSSSNEMRWGNKTEFVTDPKKSHRKKAFLNNSPLLCLCFPVLTLRQRKTDCNSTLLLNGQARVGHI